MDKFQASDLTINVVFDGKAAVEAIRIKKALPVRKGAPTWNGGGEPAAEPFTIKRDGTTSLDGQ